MLSDKFKEVLENLEKNIENENDLEYAKNQIQELKMAFLKELEETEMSFQHRLKMCEHKIELLESAVQKVEDEVFQDDIETDLEPIKCPYCSVNFFIEFDSTKKEIRCPNCNNIIELDWGNFEDDM